MDIQEIKETPIWQLYEKGRNFHRKKGIYTDTDRNYRMYNGDQWAGAKLGGVEPVQKNFIKPIVKYKLAVIHSNLYAIVYSSQNYENREFRKAAEEYCKMLNRYAANVWEKDKMDKKIREVSKAAAINDEGILYVNFDEENMFPVNEVVKKSDIYYGNENDDDIQAQPYIIIRKRMPVVNAVELAQSMGAGEDEIQHIIGDNDTSEESGEDAKEEVDDMVTVLYKMYKKNGTVHFSAASRYARLAENIDIGIPLYPVAHFNWESKEGSARGEGEVRYLIPNQIEVNKTEMRRILTVADQAFPIRVVNEKKIRNVNELRKVGGILKTQDQSVDDVNKLVATIHPAQMSPDVVKLQEDLITVTRELAGAGDIASGDIDPENASGRAILAVQQASQAPMTEQREALKDFIEDVAKIWLEYLIAYSQNGINMEQETVDPATGQETVQIATVPQSALEQLRASVKIDVTPKSVYDRFAQEQTLENLLVQGFFNVQRVSELKAYYKVLPDDSVAPKMAIGKLIEYIEQEQRKIAVLQSEAQKMQQRAQQFLMGNPDEQSSMLADAQKSIFGQQLNNQVPIS